MKNQPDKEQLPFEFKKSYLCTLFSFFSYAFLLVGTLTNVYFGNAYWSSHLHFYVWSELLAVIFFLAGECYPYQRKKTNFLEKNYGFFLQYILYIMIISRNAASANNFYDGINALDYGMLVCVWFFYALSLLALVLTLVFYVLLLRGYHGFNMKRFMRFGIITLLVSRVCGSCFESLSIATENLSRQQLIEFSTCVIAAFMETLLFYFFWDSIVLKEKDETKDI